MKSAAKLAVALLVAAGGSVTVAALPAFAAATCTATPTNPGFPRDTQGLPHITGSTSNSCSVWPWTSIGRIKEDRPFAQPDVVHQTITHTTQLDSTDKVNLDKQTCQNGDSIYIEGEAYSAATPSGKKVTQSSRRTMSC